MNLFLTRVGKDYRAIQHLQAACILLFAALVLAGPGANAPSGLLPIIDEPWNAFDRNARAQANGWINNYPGCNGSIVQDGSAPESPPNVYRAARAAGSAHGGCSISKYFTQIPATKVYGRIRFRTSNPFYGVSTGGAKLIGYVQHQGGNFILLDMERAVAGSQWFLSAGVLYQNECHLLGQPGVVIPRPEECNLVVVLQPNTGNSKNIIAGQWQDIEWIYDNGSCGTCRDGKIIVWNNGARVINFQNLNMPTTPFVSWTVTHTWDGQAMENIGVASYFDFDHMYLATYTGAIQTSLTSKEAAVGGPRLSVTAASGRVLFQMPQAGAYHISVYDLSGRGVWNHAGSGEAVWNHGGKLKKGVYLVRAEQNGRTMKTSYCQIW